MKPTMKGRGQSDSPDTAILFRGAPSIPPPEVFAEARKSNPLWVQLIEEAYEKFAALPENKGIYADFEKGATLEQVWLFFTTMRQEPHCLLARPLPKEQVSRITRLTNHSPAEVIGMLKKLQRSDDSINAVTCHYDGRTGHCIRVTSYDGTRDRFIYHDPWPARSLLCKENNMAGVDAQTEAKRWSVTSKELEKVIFASFLFPHQWARLQGIRFDMNYDEFKKTEFYAFFNLKEISKQSQGALSTRGFTVGPFKDSIVLILDCGKRDKIIRAILIIKRQWFVQNFILATDLMKSFISVFTPAPDRLSYDELVKSVWSLKNPGLAQQVLQTPFGKSELVDCLQAFLGSAKEASIASDFGHLSFDNVRDQVEASLKVEFKLF
jgi:hypothetical protein